MPHKNRKAELFLYFNRVWKDQWCKMEKHVKHLWWSFCGNSKRFFAKNSITDVWLGKLFWLENPRNFNMIFCVSEEVLEGKFSLDRFIIVICSLKSVLYTLLKWYLFHDNLNLLQPGVACLYPLKTSPALLTFMFSDVFSGINKPHLAIFG